MRGHVATTLTFVRTPGGRVRVDEGNPLPADALPEEIDRLTAAGAIEPGEVPDPEPEPEPEPVVDEPTVVEPSTTDDEPALAEASDGTPATERVDDVAPAVADTAAGARSSGRRRPGKAQEG